jgi:hypothetical protein
MERQDVHGLIIVEPFTSGADYILCDFLICNAATLLPPTMSRFNKLAELAPDAAFALIEQYKTDPTFLEVDLSPGFYRDEIILCNHTLLACSL